MNRALQDYLHALQVVIQGLCSHRMESSWDHSHSMEQLQCTRRVQGILSFASNHLTGRQAQHRPYSFATSQRRIPAALLASVPGQEFRQTVAAPDPASPHGFRDVLRVLQRHQPVQGLVHKHGMLLHIGVELETGCSRGLDL